MPSIGDIALTVAPYVVGFLLALIGFIVYSLGSRKNYLIFWAWIKNRDK